MTKIIGIDLGTTNSCVAVMEGGEAVVIANAEGTRTTPSIVGFSKNGERLVGQVAKRQAVTNSDKTFASIKRKMGTSHKVNVNDTEYTPQEISAMVLGKLKTDAESYLGETVTQAVITVPAYFNDSQRQATKDAGRIAGLEVLRIINEPTAAALSYGLDKDLSDQKILVYDLGGGTFDVSILELDSGVVEVLATNGDTSLGGDDFDIAIMNYVLQDFKDKNGINLSGNKMALQRIREASEKAKIELSGVIKTNINLPFIAVDENNEPLHIDLDITKAKFDNLTSGLVSRTIEPTLKAIADAKIKKEDIDKIILVGGSTRIPAVVEAIKNLTGKEPFKGVNPDECVALGAAIQGGVLSGDITDVLLLDVTPLSLSIETMGGVATNLIERNTTIPTKKSQIFSTAADNQTAVDIHIVQGERSMAADNKTLGRFQLSGIAPARRGIPQIEVTFDIDANGIVNVTAVDKGTNKSANITLTASTNLSETDIDKAVKEAERYAEEDKARKELIDIKNNTEQLILAIENTVSDNGDKLSDEDKASLLEATKSAAEKMKDATTVDEVKEIADDLGKVSNPIFSKLYAENPEPQVNPDSGVSNDEDVINITPDDII